MTLKRTQLIVSIWCIIFFFEGCNRNERTKKSDALEPKLKNGDITNQQTKVASLATEKIAVDPFLRLKERIASFPPQFDSHKGRWSVVSYDVRKTDSLVSPLVATITCDWDQPPFLHRYVGIFAMQDSFWVLKSLDTGSKFRDDKAEFSFSPVALNDATSPDYEVSKDLEMYFR